MANEKQYFLNSTWQPLSTIPRTVSNAIVTDTGGSSSSTFGSATRDNTLGFSGTGRVGDIVKVYDGQTLLGSTTVNSSGMWTYTTPRVGDGQHGFRFLFDGQIGIDTWVSKAPTRIDTTGPSVALNSLTTEGGYRIYAGSTVSDNNALISGAASDSGSGVSKVRIFDGDTYLGDATVSSNGAWSYTARDLVNGNHRFRAEVTDRAGNSTSQMSTSFTVSFDAGQIDSAPYKDDGSALTYGGKTNDATPTIKGRAEKGSKIELWEGNVLLQSFDVTQDGAFSFTLTNPLSEGQHFLQAKLVNGNRTERANYSVNVDTVATGSVTAVMVTDEKTGLASDMANGGETLGDKLRVTGTREAGARVEIYDNDVLLGHVNAGTSTSWSFSTNMPLDLGSHRITAKVMDTVGNVTVYSPAASEFRVDYNGTNAPEHNWSSRWGWGYVDALDGLQVVTGQDMVNQKSTSLREEITLHNIDDAWRYGYNGAGVRVAVIDTGANQDVDFGSNVLWDLSYDFVNGDSDVSDGNGHGTFVLSQMAAQNNEIGLTGAAYGAEYLVLKALNDAGSGSTYDIADAIRYAVDNGSDIINMSLGAVTSSVNQVSNTLRSAIEYAQSHGVLVLAASGNDGGAHPDSPAILAQTHDNVIAVGSAQAVPTGAGAGDKIVLSHFSNQAGTSSAYGYLTGDGTGSQGYTAEGSAQIESWSGTSMATPMVASVAALVLGADTSMSAAELRDVLMGTAQNMAVL